MEDRDLVDIQSKIDELNKKIEKLKEEKSSVLLANFPIKPGDVITRKRNSRKGKNAYRWKSVVTKVSNYDSKGEAAYITMTLKFNGKQIADWGSASIVVSRVNNKRYRQDAYIEIFGKDIKIIGRIELEDLPLKLNKKTILPA